MKKLEIKTTFEVFNSIDELTSEVKSLMNQAIEIRKKAYAPYSKFRVGAAILLDNGKIVLGSNQENAAYPSGLCAERVAIFQAGAIYPDAKIIKLAISAASDNNPTVSPIPPCGSCRQSIAEYEFKQNTPIEIFFMGESGEVYKSDSINNLLPLTFDKTSL
ncbi:cytidine deaminase [Flavobacterium capsici]|uniref:Cytidine deaminase n=1 Tax=Flavobacterium capsici TaxID=3075618 RepID=A0AA96F2M8_9FLAO|nr:MULTISPECIES: cytidine deaminase [unclassified Flavobacterium]WNM20071.1 cytidine deaminase [Flavobacterium sp. PMR2A8]WNM21460.1 cytidine deaminase [Flavobacterium sp. PMTSA4]